MATDAYRCLWDDAVERSTSPIEPLEGASSADVAIVGAGFTGLWCAYYLTELDPTLRVVVLERDTVGFGASGRNGGWCSAILPVTLAELDRRHGSGSGARAQRAMFDTVVEVERVAASLREVEGFDAHVARDGWICLARTDAQRDRLQAEVATFSSHGLGDDDMRWLDASEARDVLRATDVRGGTFTPHCAAVHPGLLVRGLAAAARRRGVVIHEGSPVLDVAPGRVRTDNGVVRSPLIVTATEAYTRDLPGRRRDLLPIYSLMIATEPVPDDVWRALCPSGRAVFNDGRREIVYGQRTADGRIAFGGRGAPYHYGSRIEQRFDTDELVRSRLAETLVQMFPDLVDVAITHHWGGPLGAARDWHPFVRYDATSGLAVAGGYVGDGVATSNLVGRTLAYLLTARDHDITTLPWVAHRARRWEPEPIRWLAVNGALRLAARLDRREARGHSPGVAGRLLGRLTGS